MKDSPGSELDRADFRILQELAGEGRISDVELSDRVNLSSTAVARRRKILEERGNITGYRASLNFGKLGYKITVIVSIELMSQAEHVLNEFEEAVRNTPSMSYCTFVSGDTDFIMMVHVKSLDDYDAVYRSELSKLPHVSRIRSSFVMREVEQRYTPPALFRNPR